MKVCIAEKPSVAREIANIIGAKAKKNGYYEGNGYCVTWASGHFCSLCEPDHYRSYWKTWDFSTLPMFPKKFEIKLINNHNVKRQFGIIKNLFSKAEVVINCGDAGQEGELIQRWILKHANYKGKVLRLWISSLTSEAIKTGFDNLKDAKDFDKLYYAGSSRAIGDWLLGINATRLYTLKYGNHKQLLSIGRVQTPTLAMLVDRHHEINNFVPQSYWELQTLYKKAIFNSEKGRFYKKEDGEMLLKQVEGKPLTITSISKKKGKEQPPRLFDLTSLQVECNKKFAFTADQTLKLIQKLYESKVVTYPRVDTTFLPNNMYPKIGSILSNLNNYSEFTEALLDKKIKKPSKVFNDKKITDHHAIIPTGIEKNLCNDEFKVYDIIAKKFIAAFYPDCIISNTKVEADVDSIKFKATGKEILEQGWRILYLKAKKEKNSKASDEKEQENRLPNFIKGESGSHKPSFLEKQTKAAKTYTEATLLRAMETAGKKIDDEELRDLMKANGIGRPSTRANIIETLFRRKYIQRDKKQIIPTEIAVQLIGIIQNKLLKSAELTGQWEKQLKKIEQGEYSAKQFIHNMKEMVTKLVYEVMVAKVEKRLSLEKTNQIETSKKSIKNNSKILEVTCPKCKKGHIVKGKTAYGCSLWKEGCKFRFPFEKVKQKAAGKIMSKELVWEILKGEV